MRRPCSTTARNVTPRFAASAFARTARSAARSMVVFMVWVPISINMVTRIKSAVRSSSWHLVRCGIKRRMIRRIPLNRSAGYCCSNGWGRSDWAGLDDFLTLVTRRNPRWPGSASRGSLTTERSVPSCVAGCAHDPRHPGFSDPVPIAVVSKGWTASTRCARGELLIDPPRPRVSCIFGAPALPPSRDGPRRGRPPGEASSGWPMRRPETCPGRLPAHRGPGWPGPAPAGRHWGR